MSSEPTTLVVVSGVKSRLALRSWAETHRAKVVSPGEALTAHRFDRVYVMRDYWRYSKREVADKWLEEELPLHLFPGVVVNVIHDFEDLPK